MTYLTTTIEYNSGSSCLQKLVVQRKGHKVLSSSVAKESEIAWRTLYKTDFMHSACEQMVSKTKLQPWSWTALEEGCGITYNMLKPESIYGWPGHVV